MPFPERYIFAQVIFVTFFWIQIPFDLKIQWFVFVTKCTKVVNLVKFPLKVCMISH